MEASLKRGAGTLRASWRFAGWADTGVLQGWTEFLDRDSSGNMRDSADFARQAVARWQSYADKHLAAESLEDVRARSRSEAGQATGEEFVVLLVLTVDQGFHPGQPLAFAYFRRTWCGGLYLEFMAGHPLAEALGFRGILRATLGCLSDVAEAASSGRIWWEATAESHPKYQALVGAINELQLLQPPVEDIFIIRAGDLRNWKLRTHHGQGISPA